MTIHLELVREHLLRQQQLPDDGRRRPPPRDRRGSLTRVRGRARAYRRHRLRDQAARRVITGFVRFIRPEELQLQPVNAESLVNEVIALVEPDVRRNGVVCRANVPGGLPALRADPALLRQALLNLALNGCQAMPNGGKLTMSAKRTKIAGSR